MNELMLVERLAAQQHGVATAAQCRAVGLSAGEVRTLCRSRRWLRLSRATYFVGVHSGSPPRRALIQAALLSAGPCAVAVRQTAAELHGIEGARPCGAIHINVPSAKARDRRGEAGVELHQMVLAPAEVTTVDGLAVTTVARTVADLLLHSDRLHAVAILDYCLNRSLLLGEDLDLVRALMVGRRGAARAWPWFEEVDARAESPLESRVRLRAADGGLRPDELQFKVAAPDGRVVAITDLAWYRSRVVGEADGAAVHDTPEAIFRDRRRQNAIVAAGYVPSSPGRTPWSRSMCRGPSTRPRCGRGERRSGPGGVE